MKNQFYQQIFSDGLGNTVKKYVWSQDMDKGIFPDGLLPVYEERVETFVIGTKMTRSEIQADRKKRSTEHFKKDVLPTLGRDEQLHFKNKFNK